LDIFAIEPYDSEDVAQPLRTLFSDEMDIVDKRKHTLLAYIRTVKVDIVLHPYPYLQPVEIIDGIRFASIPDIVAMKLNAITRRGAKKDYFDIAELLDHYSLETMLQFFTDKYAATDIGFVVRSLTYFEEADISKDPIMLKNVNWKQVKKKIQGAVQDFWRG
jgi:predicted nucleotidyltransferase component of viral defense system